MAVDELELLTDTQKERSLWQKSFSRLLKNKIAVASASASVQVGAITVALEAR